MHANPEDSIVSIATAPGRGAVGIVRVSGKDLSGLIAQLFGRTLTPRVANYLPFTQVDGSHVDNGIAIYFKAPTVLHRRGRAGAAGTRWACCLADAGECVFGV